MRSARFCPSAVGARGRWCNLFNSALATQKECGGLPALAIQKRVSPRCGWERVHGALDARRSGQIRKKRAPLYLQAIVLDGFSDFDDETRGVVEAVGRFEQVRTGVRLERDVGPDGRRRNRRRRRRPRLGRRPTRATLCKRHKSEQK